MTFTLLLTIFDDEWHYFPLKCRCRWLDRNVVVVKGRNAICGGALGRPASKMKASVLLGFGAPSKWHRMGKRKLKTLEATGTTSVRDLVGTADGHANKLRGK